MTFGENSRNLQKTFPVVATVHSPGSLRAARRLAPGRVDFLEIRVDHFAPDLAPLRRALPTLRTPFIVTVRHPAEGGQHGLSAARRRALYQEFLPLARGIDVELRSVKNLAPILTEARALGVKIILSSHHFQTTPSVARLREISRALHAAGADIGKIAARAETPRALAGLLALFDPAPRHPLSVMAMGKFGKVSRLLFAQAGSALNYGYLDQPNASGQWAAAVLQARLAELLAA